MIPPDPGSRVSPGSIQAPATSVTGGGAAAPRPDMTPPTDEVRPPRTGAQVARDIGLFFAAPFISMSYLVLFPFIGLSLLRQAWRQRHETS